MTSIYNLHPIDYSYYYLFAFENGTGNWCKNFTLTKLTTYKNHNEATVDFYRQRDLETEEDEDEYWALFASIQFDNDYWQFATPEFACQQFLKRIFFEYELPEARYLTESEFESFLSYGDEPSLKSF